MKISEKRLKEIILEEMQRVDEGNLDSASLEPKVMEIISKFDKDEEKAIVLQFITLLKGNK